MNSASDGHDTSDFYSRSSSESADMDLDSSPERDDSQFTNEPVSEVLEQAGTTDHILDDDSSEASVLLSSTRASNHKRRLSSPDNDTVKRRKVPQDTRPSPTYTRALPPCGIVPAEVMLHIFSFLPPDALCRCMRVNSACRTYLTIAHESMSVVQPKGLTRLDVPNCEQVWATSRQVFTPLLPSPLRGFSENQMLAFLGHSTCDHCGALPNIFGSAQLPPTIWSAGPGVDGVRTIWPFKSRLCGKCFATKTVTVSFLHGDPCLS